MFYWVVLILVIQISYSQACSCPGVINLPTSAAYLIGFTIALMFVIIVILAVLLYRNKYAKVGKHSILDTERSYSEFRRQESESAAKDNRCSENDERNQLKTNEIREEFVSIDGIDNDANKIKEQVESPKNTHQVYQKVRQPFFPLMDKEQMNNLLKSVLDKTGTKSTSLSDLDKIISDAKEQEEIDRVKQALEATSSPILDVQTTPPSPTVIKLPVFHADSIESKLNQEILAKFKKNKIGQGSAENIRLEPNADFCSALIHKDNENHDLHREVTENHVSEFDCQAVEIIESINNGLEEGDDLYDSPREILKTKLYDNLSVEPNPLYRQSDLYDLPPQRDSNLCDVTRTPDDLYDFTPDKNGIYKLSPATSNANNTNINIIVKDSSSYVYPIAGFKDEEELKPVQYTNARSMTNILSAGEDCANPS